MVIHCIVTFPVHRDAHKMKLNMAIAFLFLWTLDEALANDSSNLTLSEEPDVRSEPSMNAHSRKKRYIVFPKGSSLQLVYCNTYLFRPVVDIFRFGMTVGLAWQLPDDPMIYEDLKKKHKVYKRNVFKKMETFLRPGGANGRQCVLKALCESGQRTSSKKDFLREILHKIFSVDGEDEDFEENHEDKLYRKAHASVNQNCETLYPECRFSVFNAI